MRFKRLLRTFLLILATGIQTCAWAVKSPSANHLAFTQGVNVHILRDGSPVSESLRAMHDAEFTGLRVDAPWSKVEVAPDTLTIPQNWDKVVDMARQQGISVLLILDYGNKYYDGGDKPRSPEAIQAFARYAAFVADHFRGRVRVYDVWNEWDGRVGGTTQGTASSYLALVRATYLAIKKADPNALVIIGSFTPYGIEHGFLDYLLEHRGLDFSDGLSIHDYVNCQTNSGVDDWRDFLQKIEVNARWYKGEDVPIYVTETGWPSFEGKCGVSEQTQADYLIGVYSQALRMPYVKGVWWYDLIEDGTNPSDVEHHFGLLHKDLSPKPSYNALLKIKEK